ncbi:tail fiber domain-containing protein [Brucella intermedia]|uniref:tail fiber domain-containing protein n=1 Tax=Brucella intermedia TaxID=94625 RepID=UPI00236150F1|nr:tail fiber domain-containing protein [Brucella intermedia]
MGKPKAPKAPDPKETAAAQTGTNISTATANAWFQQPNQVTPDGSLTRTQTGTQTIYDPSSGKSYQIPTFTDTVTYSPEQQKIADANNATNLNLAQLARDQSGRLQGLLGQPINLDGLPAGGDASKITNPNYQQFESGPDLQTSYVDDFSTDKQAVQDAMMGRLQPKIDQERAALEQRLANQGIQLGTDAYAAAMRNFDQGVNDQRTSVLLAAGQEQSRLAGLSRDQASFGNSAKQQMYQNKNTAIGGNNALQDQLLNSQLAQFNAANTQRQQALNERYEERARPINEITALMNGAQVSKPQFGGSQIQGIPTVDYAGLVQQRYANDMGAYNQQMSQMNGFLGGLTSLLTTPFKVSDKRAKKDIEKVGRANGMNVYEYRYKGEPESSPKRIGLLAQEVRKKKPEAVAKTPSGLLAVNYQLALGGK